MYPRNFGSYKIVPTYVRLPLHVTGGESLHFKHPARFGGKRARNKKQRRPISSDEKHENLIAAVRKWEILAATKVKMSCSEKEVNRNTYISSVKRVTGRFVEFLSL